MTAACRSCGAPVVWAEHARTRRRMPLDAERVGTGLRFTLNPAGLAVKCEPGEAGHTSHFATCPNAATHRAER